MGRIGVFGGAFCPPADHHLALLNHVRDLFDKIIVVPCGPRADKPFLNTYPAVHRAWLVQLAFGRIGADIEVDNFDLENDSSVTTQDLVHKYQDRGEVWVILGSDIVGRVLGEWEQGRELWETANFVVVQRHGFPCTEGDLPPKHKYVEADGGILGSSEEIRQRLLDAPVTAHHVEGVPAAVFQHIMRYRLNTGAPPTSTTLHLGDLISEKSSHPKIWVYFDDRNPKAEETAQLLLAMPCVDEQNPDLLIVIGGDGFMLHVIRQHWHRRLPFYGINAGHLGFLLNPFDPAETHCGSLLPQTLSMHLLPLLFVETWHAGHRSTTLAFNDAWVERSSGQTAWIRVSINGEDAIPNVQADGVLVATAAGSTAYARAMGASPLPVGSPLLVVAGSNVAKPFNWRPVYLSVNETVRFDAIDSAKRPLRAVVDGLEKGPCDSMVIRVSKVAGVELGFRAASDIVKKVMQMQFPRTESFTASVPHGLTAQLGDSSSSITI
eukprot:TRINITY_DN4373_c0_g1_i2.p1 TRINITY_DN4373_c0_g1~~TRINITY_DN4373_c0_g1_i2.p1  ORF type:complete len:502 (-),score=50.01 TRINITY_DN4373_c0_g1_i2:119-1597(-)